eukprot:m.11509 g.11509  ORF g.11509 m.11509 type:complete len:66 (-) comp5759_c0_seq1:345-542(-)
MLSLSAALAVINILPAYSLDGQFALHAWLRILWPDASHERTSQITLSAVSLVLLFNVVGSILLIM